MFFIQQQSNGLNLQMDIDFLGNSYIPILNKLKEFKSTR